MGGLFPACSRRDCNLRENKLRGSSWEGPVREGSFMHRRLHTFIVVLIPSSREQCSRCLLYVREKGTLRGGQRTSTACELGVEPAQHVSWEWSLHSMWAGKGACTACERGSELVRHVSREGSLHSMWAGKRVSTACEQGREPAQHVSGKASQYSMWAGKEACTACMRKTTSIISE
jgi:hypothetical protein